MDNHGSLLGFSFYTGVLGFPSHLDRMLRTMGYPTLLEYTFYQLEILHEPKEYYAEVSAMKRFDQDGPGHWKFGSYGSSKEEALQSCAYYAITHQSYELQLTSGYYTYYQSRYSDAHSTTHHLPYPGDSRAVWRPPVFLPPLTALIVWPPTTSVRLSSVSMRLSLLHPVTHSDRLVGHALIHQCSPTPPPDWRFPDIEPYFCPTPTESSPPRSAYLWSFA